MWNAMNIHWNKFKYFVVNSHDIFNNVAQESTLGVDMKSSFFYIYG